MKYCLDVANTSHGGGLSLMSYYSVECPPVLSGWKDTTQQTPCVASCCLVLLLAAALLLQV
jgi:hypothetical protein